jgi:hypothetical protein
VHGDVKPANVIVDRYGRVKLLCIGRNADLTAEDVAAGAGDGKIDSFLFSSREQQAGDDPLTPAADLFALHAMLFYFLTGEYEARVPGADLLENLPAAARQAHARLVQIATADEARAILRTACQELSSNSLGARVVIDCFRAGTSLSMSAETSAAPTAPSQPVVVSPTQPGPPDGMLPLAAEYALEAQAAWPLGGTRVLVWESGADTLAILDGADLLWRDGQSIRVRRVTHGPSNSMAVAGWGGQLRCFADGRLATSVDLGGVVGDIQWSEDRWLVGTWKGALFAIAFDGTVRQLLGPDEGVFRIASASDGDRFAVADLSGGIALYAGAERRAMTPPLGMINGMAFAGRQLVVLVDAKLASVTAAGQLGPREQQPAGEDAQLFPAPTSRACLLVGQDGAAWKIDEEGRHLPYPAFPARRALLMQCSVPGRYTATRSDGGCTYWRDNSELQIWPEARGATLSSDGHSIVVTAPGTVRLYRDLS